MPEVAMLRSGLTGALLLFAAAASAQTTGPSIIIDAPEIVLPPVVIAPPAPLVVVPPPPPPQSAPPSLVIPSAALRPVRPGPAPTDAPPLVRPSAPGGVDLTPHSASPLVDPALVLIRMPERAVAILCDGKVVTVALSASRSGGSEERCHMTKRSKASDADDRFAFSDDQLGIDNNRAPIDRAEIVMDGFWEHVLKDAPEAPPQR
jgi:hypothetical protein